MVDEALNIKGKYKPKVPYSNTSESLNDLDAELDEHDRPLTDTKTDFL
jgi:hypothetical protein